MSLQHLTLASLLLAPSVAASADAIKCPLVFDGRVKNSLALTDFDASSGNNPFVAGYVKGEGLKWSDILVFPGPQLVSGPGGGPRFENATEHKPVTATLSDKSIFMTQRGFRRAGLQFNGDSNTGGKGSTGVKTLHWSLKIDPGRALNLSHEYLNVWHETSDYSANQFNFEMGTILGQTSLPRDTFKVLNRQNRQIWSTKNTLRVYYSKGDAALKPVTNALTNDNSGNGQYQIGMLKKPTGTSDVVNFGYQEKEINEGLIYSGIFLEDSANGCISL